MKKYVKSTHLTSGVPFYLFGGMIWGCLVICFLADRNSMCVGGGILVYIAVIAALLSIVSGKLMGAGGMYFDGEDIYYAPFSPLMKKYKVEPEQIIAIKIVRDLTAHPRLMGSGVVIEDAMDWQGNYYYDMVFLDSLEEESSGEEDEFSESYGGHVCGMCIYDETVIEYMQMRNPKIYVIPDDSNKPKKRMVVTTPQVVAKSVRGRIGKVRPKK